jgi:hypothetical protein
VTDEAKERLVRIETFLDDQKVGPADIWLNPDDKGDVAWIEHWESEALRAPHPLYRIVVTEFVEVARNEVKTKTHNKLVDVVGED